MLISKFPMGVKIITGQVSGFTSSAVVDTPGSITISWTKPVGFKHFKGVVVRYKVGSYPTSPTDGTQAYSGTGTTTTVTELTANTRYYFMAFAYAQNSSGTKTIYNTDTTGAQANTLTYANPITNMAVAKVSSTSLSVSWTAPAGTHGAVYVRRKEGSYPANSSDGVLVYGGAGTSFTDTGLVSGTTYYYRAAAANADSIMNMSIATQQGCNTTKLAAGQLIFTTSQSYTIPTGLTIIDVFCVGGGSGGGDALGSGGYSGSGGVSGFTATALSKAVTPGSQVAVIIGAGSTNDASGGGTTSFGSLLYAAGGSGQFGGSGSGGASKGSGGSGGTGGSNGGAGGYGYNSTTGTNVIYRSGAGVITKAFAETSNTLYSGGGGAGSRHSAGGGGAGGGGAGGLNTVGNPATANTGGGGGGGADVNTGNGFTGGTGAAGVVIIRWAEQ